jgi:hypothetical protein
MATLTWPDKDPDEVLDFQVDWSERLDDGDVISTSTFTVPAGLTLNSSSKTDTTTTAWLQGGTLNSNYDVLNRIVTTGGRTMDQTIRLRIRAK